MTRRNFLRSLVSFLLAVLALASFSRPKQWVYNFANRFRPRLDPLSPRGTLSKHEIDALVAFGETLIGEKPFSEAEKEYLRGHIDYQTKNTPGFFSAYRLTANLLQDMTSSGEFVKLAVRERIDLLKRHDLLSYDVQAREYLSPFHRQELTTRTLIIPDLIGGYYASPAGWAVVRYDTFPGRCGDLSLYTRPEVSNL
jgi:hypothetical protein